MTGESKKDQVPGESSDMPATEKDTANSVKKKQRGFFSRIWNGLFRMHGDDFEKRLQHISKEEAAILARTRKRSHNCRRMIKHLIVYCVILEVIAVGYAIMTTRSLELNWKMRAFRVLPMFLLPGLSFLTYSAVINFTRMCDQRDQRALKKLQAERKAKIDELKERTNYYSTQQLIQKYDPDPAAKAAAASVLASKLGADSGLKVYLGDESQIETLTGKSNDVELVQSSGLRNRKQLHKSSNSTGNTVSYHSDEDMVQNVGNEGPDTLKHDQVVVEHHRPYPGAAMHDGGWIARVAALLVGEDPTQSYALICGSCHMHNGLARKEDFPYITYYCPHCNALNRSKQSEEIEFNPDSQNLSSSTAVGSVNMANNVVSGGKDDNIPPETDTTEVK